MMRLLPFAAALLPLVSGCATGVCGAAMHPVQTVRTAKYGVERLDPKRRAEEFKRVAEGDLKDRDFTAYVAFVVSELRLKDVLQAEMAHTRMIHGYRVETVDGFAGPQTFDVSAKMEVVPDYGLLVKDGVKSAFGMWGFLVPGKLVARIGRELTIGNRYVAPFLNVGVDETDLEFFAVAPDGVEIPLGRARTDVSGRATLAATPVDLASGEWPLIARVASHLPPGLASAGAVDVQRGAVLFVRHLEDPPEQVVVVDVSGTVFASRSAKSLYSAAIAKRYDLVDACTQPALASLAQESRLVFLSGAPDGMLPMVRDELAREGITSIDGRSAPVIFKRFDLVHHEKTEAFEAQSLRQQKAFWGDVAGYISSDAVSDRAAASAAGVPFFELSKAGWCAGVDTLLPPTPTTASR